MSSLPPPPPHWPSSDAASPHNPTLLHALASAAQGDDALGVTLVAEHDGEAPQQRSYRALFADARRFAAALRERGVRPGDRVLLVLPTGFDFVAAFFGAQLCGAIPAPAYPPAGGRLDGGLARLAQIAARAGARVCVTWREATPVLGDLALRVPCLERIVAAHELHEGVTDDEIALPDPDHIAFIQYTSGSTGTPKGVSLSHRNVIANTHAIGRAVRIRPGDKMAGWLPLYHDMGLVGQLLWPVYWRIPTVPMSPLAFLSRPRRWLRMLTDHGATLSQAPNFGFALAARRVTAAHRVGLDLSALRVVLCGAEPIHCDTLRAFAQAFAPCGLREQAILPVYGMAECTVGAAFADPDQPPQFDYVRRGALSRGIAEPHDDGDGGDEAIAIASVGTALPGHAVRVVDADGRALPERSVGEVTVSGPSVMRGYYDDPAATARAFRDGWLLTGDLGYTANGQLYIAGRAKDVIIIAGENHYAEDLEAAAETVAEVRGGSAVAFAVHDETRGTEAAVLVCESRCHEDRRAGLADAIRERVLERCQIGVSEVAIVEPGSVPKTSSGKRRRNECRERYLAGRLAPEPRRPAGLGLTLLRSQAGYLTMAARRLRR